MFSSKRFGCAIVLVFQLIVCSVASQNNTYTIKGKIVDENNSPIHSINVQLFELGLHTLTDYNGFFEFNNIAYGSYQLHIEDANYKNLIKQIDFTDSENIVTIVLKKSEKLDEVVVVGKKQYVLEKHGYEVNVLSLKNELQNTKTLNQILGQVSNINVRQSGGLGSRTNYSLNGLSDNSIRFFIDGIPMEYYGASFSVNTIPVSVIDKIEIFKGVTPIYLSNDNLGGAINLITKKTNGNTAEVAYSYGSFNTHISSFYTNLESKNKQAYLNVFGFYNYSDNNYDIWGEDVLITDPITFETSRNNRVERFHDKFESKGVKTSIGLKNKNWANKLETGFIYADFDKELQHGTTMEIPFGEATYAQKNYTSYLEYKKSKLLKEKLGIQFYAAYSDLTRVFIDTTKNIYNWNGEIIGQRTLGGEQYGRLTQNTLEQQSFIQKLSADYKITPKHTAYFTSQFAFIKREDNDPTIINRNEAYFTPQHFNKNTFGFSLNSKWLESRLKTSVFIKNHSFNADIKTTLDGQTFTNTTADENLLGYGFSAAYKITQQLLVNTSFEKSNRLPEEQEVLGNGVNILSTDALDAEQSFNYNIGLQHLIPLNEHATLNYNFSFFRRDVENLIKLWQQNDAAFVYINFDDVVINGVDLEVDYKWKNKLRVNYSISRLFPTIKTRFDENGNPNLLFDTDLPNTLLLKSTLNAQLNFNNTFKKNDGFSVKWSSNFTDSFFVRDNLFGSSNKDEIPQQLSHNIGINYQFPNKKISIGLDCNNIFNEQLFDNFAIQKPGRAFFTKINWSIL